LIPKKDIGHIGFPVGTIEHLWQKWYRKLWKAYPVHATRGDGEPPAWLKKQFYRDVRLVLEHELSIIAPEKSYLIRERIMNRLAGAVENLSKEKP